MSFIELLDKLNELDEHTKIEAKSARSSIGTSILETICAFANEPQLGGGYILLGVEQNTEDLFPSYIISGVKNLDKLQTDIASQCATVFNAPIRPEISVENIEINNNGEFETKHVITIFVPEAQASEKPIYIKSKGLPRGAYRRIGSADVQCTEDDLMVFYQGRQNQSFDETIIKDSDVANDIDPDAIEEYRKARRDVNPDAEELQWPDNDLLIALRCAKQDNGILRPTIAGILLFGKTLALRRCFPMTRADYIRISGKEWVENPDERFNSIDMRSPLMRLIRRVQTTIADDLPKSFYLESGDVQRKDTPAIPLRALREAVVNALMHRDYKTNSPIQIIRYSNRIEIRNPGYSLKNQDRLGEPGSEARNPTIAAVLHETNFAETKGSGISVMRRQMEDAHLLPPTFESDREKNEFRAFFLFHHLLNEDDLKWLSNFSDYNLSEDDQRVLIAIRELGAITNQAYRDMNRVDTLAASQRLRSLCDIGLLEKRGKGSATYYIATQKLLQDDKTQQVLDLSGGVEPLSGGVKPLSGGVKPLSGGVEPLSGGVEFPSVDILELPLELMDLLQHLGERNNPEKLQEVILELCAWRPFKPSELAVLLNRNQKYLTGKYLAKMLSAGLLEYTIKDIPYHQDQAYRTVNKESSVR